MKFSPEKGSAEVLDVPVFAPGSMHQTVWCSEGHLSFLVKVAPASALAANKPSGLPYAIEPPSVDIPPAMPRQAVERAREVQQQAIHYSHTTDPYYMRLYPLDVPTVAFPVSDAEISASTAVLDADRAHRDYLDDLAELQSKRQAIGEKAFLELLRKDHPCGDE